MSLPRTGWVPRRRPRDPRIQTRSPQQAAHRERLGVLALLEGRLLRPDRFGQDDVRHQQRTRCADIRAQQRVDALVLCRIIVEPQAQQDIGVDADHRPADLRPARLGACLSRRCLATASSICSTVSGAECGDLSSPRIRRASGWTCRAVIVLSAWTWKSRIAPACRFRRSRISFGRVSWPLLVSVANRVASLLDRRIPYIPSR